MITVGSSDGSSEEVRVGQGTLMSGEGRTLLGLGRVVGAWV